MISLAQQYIQLRIRAVKSPRGVTTPERRRTRRRKSRTTKSNGQYASLAILMTPNKAATTEIEKPCRSYQHHHREMHPPRSLNNQAPELFLRPQPLRLRVSIPAPHSQCKLFRLLLGRATFLRRLLSLVRHWPRFHRFCAVFGRAVYFFEGLPFLSLCNREGPDAEASGNGVGRVRRGVRGIGVVLVVLVVVWLGAGRVV